MGSTAGQCLRQRPVGIEGISQEGVSVTAKVTAPKSDALIRPSRLPRPQVVYRLHPRHERCTNSSEEIRQLRFGAWVGFVRDVE